MTRVNAKMILLFGGFNLVLGIITSRFFALAFSVSFAVLAGNGLAQTTATESARKPNVIMVFTDDMGYGDISSFADTPLKVKTPNIDRLAKEGMKFTQYYVNSPICSPSRAAVLSGMFAPETGITSFLHEREENYTADQNDYMDPAIAHLPKSFDAAGYATAHIGKWHLGGGRDVDNAPSIGEYGYDEFYSTWESPDRDPKLGTTMPPWNKKKDPGQVDRWDRTRYMVDKTLDFMKRHEGEPAFITLWPDDLHTPFWPSPEMVEKYKGEAGAFDPIENFYGVLEEYDRQIGRLLDGLKAQGMEENTIIFFTGDNGPAPHYDHTRTNGMRGMKISLYEGGIRQPFLIRWPGHIPAGSENNETVLTSIDLLPTLTALAGIEITPAANGKMDGEDLSQAMLGARVKRKGTLYWEHGRRNEDGTPRKGIPLAKNENRSPNLAIREGEMKLLINDDGTSPMLYNVKQDPKESKDLAGEQKETVETLKAKVLDWQKSLPHRTHPYPVPQEKK